MANNASEQNSKVKEIVDGKQLTYNDMKNLSRDPYFRFQKNSKKVGHAAVYENSAGHLTAVQYPAPSNHKSVPSAESPKFTELDNFKVKNKYGTNRFTATTPKGTKMVATRSIDLTVKDKTADEVTQMKLLSFSPEASHLYKGDVFWPGKTQNVKLFKDSLKDIEDELKLHGKDELSLEELEHAKQELDDFKTETGELPVRYRHGATAVKCKDVLQREALKKRSVTQNKVMGDSAFETTKDFVNEYQSSLTTVAKKVITKSTKAEHLYRPEWLHAVGHGLTPMDKNPQTKTNLGSAPKWLNTRMMQTEKTLSWYAVNNPDALVKVATEFKMLLDTDLIESGKIQGIIEHKGKIIELFQALFPFERFPKFNKPTDIAQAILFVNNLVHDYQQAKTSPVAGVALPLFSTAEPRDESILPAVAKESVIKDKTKDSNFIKPLVKASSYDNREANRKEVVRSFEPTFEPAPAPAPMVPMMGLSRTFQDKIEEIEAREIAKAKRKRKQREIKERKKSKPSD